MVVEVFDAIAVKSSVIVGAGSQTKPSLAFGDGDTGFYKYTSNNIAVSIAGSNKWYVTTTAFQATNGDGAGMLNANASVTVPTLLPNRADTDTGIGSATANALSLIAGAFEGLRLTKSGSYILLQYRPEVGITADVSSVQGGGVIHSSYNIYSTVANAGDAATLPAAFGTGTTIKIKNDGANAMDIFPASGDDLGAGANTAASLAAGASITYIATAASATWTSIGN